MIISKFCIISRKLVQKVEFQVNNCNLFRLLKVVDATISRATNVNNTIFFFKFFIFW